MITNQTSMNQDMIIEMTDLRQPLHGIKGSGHSRISHFSVKDLETALQYIRENWKSGMAQAILNWPFNLSIGNKSGTSGSMGMTTAFIAAFVNGFFSGSNHSIYMPSQVITAYTFSLVHDYGVEIVPWVTFLSGIMIYLSNLFKWHHLSDYLPTYVIEGYQLGIGIKFFLEYMDYAFGLTDAHTNRGFRVYPNTIAMFASYIERGSLWHLCASFTVFFILQMGRRISKPFPWIIVSCCIGVALGVIFPTERCLRYVYGKAEFTFYWIGIPDISTDNIPDIVLRTITISIFITVQNLLCARGAQTLTGVKCDYDQETLCVSVANMVSGLCGGLPCCSASRMYHLHIKMRETNKWSSIINALSIYIFYGYFSGYFLDMPLYMVSGQMLFRIYQYPPITYLQMLYKTRRNQVLLKTAIVACICYNYGAIESTIIGSLHALFLFAKKMGSAACEIIVKNQNSPEYTDIYYESKNPSVRQLDDAEDDIPFLKGTYVLYRFNGAINYINIKTHIEQIQQLQYNDYIIFSFRYVSVFDDQAIDKLAQFIENMMKSGCQVMITGLHSQMITEMEHNDFFKNFFNNCPEMYQILGH